jgi:uncharacterized membrane protein YbhN (UPF0104 family)
MKKLHAFLLALGVVFLGWLVWKIGARTLWQQLAALGWGLLLFIALEFAAEVFHTVGWRCCLSGAHRQLSLWRIFQIRMAGYAINYLTPTAALGGEATKAAFLHSHQPGPESVGAVLAGKLCTGIAHLLFVIAGSAFVIGSVTLPRAIWAAMVTSTAIVAAGMAAFLLLQRNGKLGGVIRWLAARKFAGQFLRNAAREFSDVDEVLRSLFHNRPLALAKAVGWTLVGHSIGFLQTWWFFHLLRLPASLGIATSIWVLGMWFDMLTFIVPLNLGTLEGSRIAAFKSVGFTAVPGMTYGVALRLAQLACACFGLVVYVCLMARKAPPNSASRRPENLNLSASNTVRAERALME